MTHEDLKLLNRGEIDEARELLQSFQKDGFYTVPKITWWVLHYEELYKYSYENRHTGSCIEGMGCACSWDSPEYRFQSLHAALQEVVELHQYEGYFRGELVVLETVQDDYPTLLQWLKKNEKLGSDDFCLFWIDWVDEEQTRIDPCIMSEKELEIKFRIEEWKYTITFLERFNEIYWDSELCRKN